MQRRSARARRRTIAPIGGAGAAVPSHEPVEGIEVGG